MPDAGVGAELQESEERYRVLFTKAKIPMLLIEPDDGTIFEANEAACLYYGYRPEQLVGMKIADINTFSPEQVREEMMRAEREQRSQFFFRHRLASGEVRDVEVYSGPLDINGHHLLYSVIHDIAERRRAEQLLKKSEARFRHIMEHAPLGIALFDLEGRFIRANDAMCEIVGMTQTELVGLSTDAITHPDDIAVSNQYMQSLIEGKSIDAKFEKRYLHRDGHPVWVQISLTLERDWSEAPYYFIGILEDISLRKEAEQRINFLAQHDRLTSLPNRELFLDRFSGAIARAKRRKKMMALFFLDLDGFKAVNDNFGHKAGDIVLTTVAKRLSGCVRDVDTVARLGGDEFAIIFDEIENPRDVAPVAEKIIRHLSEPMSTGNKEDCHIGVSIGIAMYPENGDEIDHLLSAADDAMYTSKRNGKNTYTYCQGKAHGNAGNHPWITLDEERLVGEPEIDHQHQELVRMLNELNDAVRNNEPLEEVAHRFDEMTAYTEKHFAVEEQMMDKYDYPETGVHKAEHKRLLEEAGYLKQKLARGGELLVLQSLKDWLLAHTIHVDKPFVEYLHRHGVK